MTISVVTTCMGRLDHIKQTLPLLYHQKPDEYIVVDWSCPDKVGEWLKANYPKVKVVEVPGKTAFHIAGARNVGAAAATCDWLMFVDADTLILPKSLERIQTLTRVVKDNAYLKSERQGDLWGFTVVRKRDWENVKFNENMTGWGFEDEEFDEGLRKSGLIEVKIDKDYLRFIPHDDLYRVANYEEKDKHKSRTANLAKRRNWGGEKGAVALAAEIDGWMTLAELGWLAEHAKDCQTIIELGSWKGRSTKALAMMCPGTVYCVDSWSQDWALHDFKINLGAEIENKKLIPIKSTTDDGVAHLQGVQADFVFIDADHGYESVIKDIKNYMPLVKPGGIISGHDYSASWPGVVKAVDEIFPDKQRGPGDIWYVVKQ